ncbi:MAG: hypothetical protein BGO31_16900 [Bacteroidetes bacterium 43-16]|uniref:hypothetical protein n=1 Tax=uncultured Flavobacterium sp. TaxID=165435 RepID=UPI00092C94D1|nr:hypothetical protein [uncultured Flavobacterium sp.]OJV55773.1 MAG: hypothetical protein BGO31_16900 [Bacteroidetes bacterium 43-16]
MKMDNKKFLFDLPEDEKKKQSYKAAYVYGSEIRDRILNEPKSLPRYAALASKALSFYGGEHYNPYTVAIHTEVFIRKLIQNGIEKKVFYKAKYNWVYIDHFLRKVIGTELQINIPYDQSVLDTELASKYKVAYSHPNDTVN